MKKFSIFFSGEQGHVLEKLQNESMVEIGALPETFGFEKILTDKTRIEEKIARLEFLKGVVKKVEGKDFSGRILLSGEEERDVVEKFPLEEIYGRFLKISGEVERREKLAARISTLKNELETISLLEIIPSDLFSLRNFSFLLFGLDKKSQYFPEDMDGVTAEKAGEKGNQVFWMAVFPGEMKKKVLADVERRKGKILNIRRWNKKPVDIISKLDRVFENNCRLREKAEREMEDILRYKNRIFVYYDHISSVLNYVLAQQRLGSSKFVKGFAGWIKAKDVARFEKFIKEHIPEAFLHTQDPAPGENVPISFENTRLVEPFEVVTDLYGRPAYRNIDPTGHLSLFFAVSFAFCITDAGYGLILILLALLLMKKFRLMPAFAKFMKLLLYSGIATLLMGIITGSWFGDLLKRLPESFLPARALKGLVILDPLGGGNKAFIFLGWAIIIGYIQIVWGLVLNLYNSVKETGLKKSGEAVSLLSIQLLAGILIAVIAAGHKRDMSPYFIRVPAVLLGLSFLYLMQAKAREQKGIVMKLFWAFYGAYNVMASNLLGDILSYSRLFGLGLTTAVLGLVVNEMVFMSTGIPYAGYIIAAVLFIGGHLGNLAINLLGGYVHTSRLQYLEFFTKFFESGGKEFNPLKKTRKYTCITGEKGS